ncbi:hypothetical protein EF910_32070 [Streptomyces sp. WAC07149]|uniref:hypothetical protein n=1 Tax=Streptomyces sp. WAC07149 TaxID=2487425 RepID=UPI000F7B6E70|nr:hypothetical protein [Streptomyces sp. WAC07149]RST00373.1 hypothetical protein EF910_32070 [Streptomyces sp. WAC07149]
MKNPDRQPPAAITALAQRLYALLLSHPDRDYSHAEIRHLLGVADDRTYRLAFPVARKQARLDGLTITQARYDRERKEWVLRLCSRTDPDGHVHLSLLRRWDKLERDALIAMGEAGNEARGADEQAYREHAIRIMGSLTDFLRRTRQPDDDAA